MDYGREQQGRCATNFIRNHKKDVAHTEERISKILSARGVCSRRAAEDLLRDGRVTVNNAVAAVGQKADAERDRICVDGRLLGAREACCYLMLHKPRGYVTTVSDERGRKTVMDLLPENYPRVWPVGRLDMDSEGLLLLTNDGDLTHRLLHPSHEVRKTYHVWVEGDVSSALAPLRAMTDLAGERICPPGVRVLKQTGAGGMLSVVIHEGKNRQVRRMCAAVGLRVTRLKRVGEGRLVLGALPMGQWRPLTEEEVALLKKL